MAREESNRPVGNGCPPEGAERGLARDAARGLAEGYLPHTPEDRRSMLETIAAAGGPGSLEGLLAGIPAACRPVRPLSLPEPLDEISLTAHVHALAGRNAGPSDLTCFLGGGQYDHFVPAAVDALASRGEFFTSYTPYQPEASQGSLQVFFEYQSLVSELTGLEVSNMSLYDGASAAAEAVLMAVAAAGPGRTRVVIPTTVHPHSSAVVVTYLRNIGIDVVEVEASNGCMTPEALAAAVDATTACVLLQQPNVFGRIEPLGHLAAAARGAGATVIVSVDPISLGILRRPGDAGADIVVAEGQSLGNHLGFGGPSLGLLACRESFIRRVPGRLAGQTTDKRGNRCWVLTLQTREQHIRREKATSNVCTNQGLLALRAAIHLALLGPAGLTEVARSCLSRAHHARKRLLSTGRFESACEGAFFKEFVLRDRLGRPRELVEQLVGEGFLAGIPLGSFLPKQPRYADCLLVAVTEKRSADEIERLSRAVERLSARGAAASGGGTPGKTAARRIAGGRVSGTLVEEAAGR
jgi:glycine dehydrogenase subunit 1